MEVVGLTKIRAFVAHMESTPPISKFARMTNKGRQSILINNFLV